MQAKCDRKKFVCMSGILEQRTCKCTCSTGVVVWASTALHFKRTCAQCAGLRRERDLRQKIRTGRRWEHDSEVKRATIPEKCACRGLLCTFSARLSAGGWQEALAQTKHPKPASMPPPKVWYFGRPLHSCGGHGASSCLGSGRSVSKGSFRKLLFMLAATTPKFCCSSPQTSRSCSSPTRGCTEVAHVRANFTVRIPALPRSKQGVMLVAFRVHFLACSEL